MTHKKTAISALWDSPWKKVEKVVERPPLDSFRTIAIIRPRTVWDVHLQQPVSQGKEIRFSKSTPDYNYTKQEQRNGLLPK